MIIYWKNAKYQYVKCYTWRSTVTFHRSGWYTKSIQKFRASDASGGESQPLNNTSRTLFKKPGLHIAHTVLLQKESENQSFYPIEKTSEPQFSD